MQELDVQLLDSSGNTLYPATRTSGTSIWHNYAIINRPTVEFTVWDSTYGRVTALDAVTPYMIITEPVTSVGCVRFFVAPQTSGIVGYMCLVPLLDGEIIGDSFQVVVGGSSVSVAWFPDILLNGNLSFYRNTASNLDTLKDGDSVVAGLITNIELEVVRQ